MSYEIEIQNVVGDSFTIKEGDRVEISPSCDLWMFGAKYGEITKIEMSGEMLVRMDHWQVKNLIRVNPNLIMRKV